MKISVIVGIAVTAVSAFSAGQCSAENAKVWVGSDSTAVHNTKNGHYYEFVAEEELTWPQAKKLAESRVLEVNGKFLRGYLVTLAEEHEQELLKKHFLGPPNVKTDVWMGGTDSAVDDEWRWVTGPEGKADGGKGKLFSIGNKAVGYAAWLGSEPNNSGGIESYMQWNHVPRPTSTPASWNDQPIDKPGSKGYFVEYGGLE